jgi:hypothetical protein
MPSHPFQVSGRVNSSTAQAVACELIGIGYTCRVLTSDLPCMFCFSLVIQIYCCNVILESLLFVWILSSYFIGISLFIEKILI